MKKVLFILITCLIGYHGFTREKAERNLKTEYISVFGETSTSWNIYFEIPDLLVTDSVFVSGDTVIHDQDYKKVKRDGFIKNTTYFLRENMNHSKVIYYSAVLDSEFVVMDLDLELADSFYLGNERVNPLIVDSVYFADNRKHIRFDTILEVSGQYEKFEFIEGVGTNFGLFYPEEIFLPFQHYLLCAYHDGNRIFDNKLAPGQCNLSWSSVHENEYNSGLLIFPNPADEQVFIKWEGYSVPQQLSCHLYNSAGLKIKTWPAELLPITLNTQVLTDGLYFILIEGDNWSHTGKLMIRH